MAAAVASAVLLPSSALLASPSHLDTTFKPGIYHDDNVWHSLAQPDGRILLAGPFQSVAGQPQKYLARLHANGSLDTSFAPQFDAVVTSFALQKDGKILVKGVFTTINGVPRQELARLHPDGTLDESFAPELGDWTFCFLLQNDGKIIVAGNPNGTEPNGVRLNVDGTIDETFSFKANGTVMCMAPHPDGRIFICGTFTTVNGSSRATIARLNLDGSLDATFSPIVNDRVYAVVVEPNGATLLGGAFTTVNGLTKNRMARILANGTLDLTFTPRVNFDIYGLALQVDGKINICGSFNNVSDLSRAGIARLNANGSVDSSFASTTSAFSGHHSLFVQPNGQILHSGGYSKPGSAAAHNVERYLGDAAFQSLAATSSSRVEWLRSGGGPEIVNASIELSMDGGSTWQDLGAASRVAGGWELTGLSLPPAGSLRARGSVWGGLHRSSSTMVEQVAAFGGLAPEMVVEGPDGSQLADGVGQVTLPSNRTWHTFVIRNTGTAPLDLGVPTPVPGWAFANEFQLDLAGLRTPLPAGQETSFKVRLEPYTEGTRSAKFTLANSDATHNPFDLHFAGPGALSRHIDVKEMSFNYQTSLGQTHSPFIPLFAPTVSQYLVRIPNNLMRAWLYAYHPAWAFFENGTASINGQSVPSPSVMDPLPLSRASQQVLNIEFTSPDGVAKKAYSLDVQRLPPQAGDVDLTFGAGGASRWINGTALLPNGQMLLFGSFTAIQGVNQRHLARLSADGAIDPTFNPLLSAGVEGVIVQPDGKILIRGPFSTVNGKPRARWARLLPSGALDETLLPPVFAGGGPWWAIKSMALQDDDKILIVGNFTSVDDLSRPGFVRLNPNGTVDNGFIPTHTLIDRVAVQADGRIICSRYTSGTSTGEILRLYSDGSPDPTFYRSTNQQIHSIALQPDQKVVIGGYFTQVGGTLRDGLARLHVDSTLDTGFAPFGASQPTCFALRADGKVFFAKSATSQRLGATGQFENTFNPDRLGTGLPTSIHSVMMTNGGPVFGGDFGTWAGVPAEGFVRVHDDPPAPIPAPLAPTVVAVAWQPPGTAPAPERVLFQLSTDGGSTWMRLGMGVCSGGSWTLNGIQLPGSGKVRALAYARSGLNNGSQGIFASPVADFSFAPAAIEVREPDGAALVNGSAEADFGAVALKAAVTRTFVLRNAGETHLQIGGISIQGSHSKMFSVSSPPVSLLPAGAETTLAVTFSPASLGEKTASLQILSNDEASPSFAVALNGTGVTTVAPIVKTLPAAVTGHDSAELTGSIDAKGVEREVVFDWGRTTKFGATTAALKASGLTESTVMTAVLSGLLPHTKYHYRIRTTGPAGGAAGATMTFTTRNRVPAAADDSFTLTGDFPVLFQPLANDSDPDSDPLTLVSVTLKTPGPSKVTRVGNAVQVTVSGGDPIHFEYQVADGFGGKATAMATVVKMPLVSIVSPIGFDAIGGAQPIFYSPGEASLGAPRSPAAWLKVAPSPLRVTAAPNLSKHARFAVLEFGGGLVLQVTQSGKQPAYLDSLADAAATVGLPFSQSVSGGNGPLSVTATNLPPGLKIVENSSKIAGVPTKAGVYNVVLRARNSVGLAVNEVTFTITVQPAPEQVIGTFHGFIARSDLLNDLLGSRLEFTSAITGAVTGKIITGAKSQSFKGAFTAVSGIPNARQLRVTLPTSDGGSAPLIIVVNGSVANYAKGTLADQPVTAWRQIWRAGTPATTYKGAHSFYLAPPVDSHLLPQGYGFGVFTVDEKTGALKIVGKLADDSGLTSSTFAGPQGQVLVYQSLYGNRGSFAGVLSMSANHRVTGAPTWYKDVLPPGVSPVDLMYRDGFGPEIYAATGGELPAVAPGGIIGGLTKIANNAWFEFRRGGLEIEETEFDIGISLMNYGATGLTNTAIFPSDNPFTVTLKQIKTAAGSYAGEYTVPGLSGAPNRKVTFQGQFVNDGVTSRGYGFFILPQPAATVPLLRSALRSSGSVLLRERLPGDG